MYKNVVNVLKISGDIIDSFVAEGHRVADCTMGKGNDSLRLARRVGDRGLVYAFDIQDLALEKTRQRLEEAGLLDRVRLIKDGHENMARHIDESLDLIIYNLGYLPGGKKDLTTKYESSIRSMDQGLELLREHGLMVIVAYIGHDGGLEGERVEAYLEGLDQKDFNVLKYEFINQVNNPPRVYLVEKSGLGK